MDRSRHKPLPLEPNILTIPTNPLSKSPVHKDPIKEHTNTLLRTSTPVFDLSTTNDHGLPSPQTPSFHHQIFNREDISFLHQDDGPKASQHTASHPNSVENQVPATPELTVTEETKTRDQEPMQQSELFEPRRSSRISAKLKAKATESVSTPVAAPAKSSNGSAKKTHMEPIATSCEIEKKVPSIQVDLVPFEGLPALNSVEWQLQYPPGGSTHPSYPFPTPDPRLIFHESLVPVNDGLPDCARVAPLVLPFGWRQVSWCGLLPIVFDPYQQAFKLTPAGPLPLVHEELLQNGLAKYVPGGELHPETGMLPDMTLWSDGSEGVVYDWPGVSWTLPWADQGHFDFLDKTHISSGATNDGVQTDDQTLVSLSVTWREERDCPNQVFDLHDGWRWMADKEQRPNEDFVPDNTKRWYRSGALRCVRKFKSPIPELMMLAMMEDQEVSNPVLHNQDARIPQKNNFFCPFKSVSTPVNVDMTVLADTEFTLVELLSYFPQHFNWGAAAERLHRAGIQPSMIRDAIYMTRGLSDDVNGLSTSSISAACYAAKRRDLEQGLHHEAKEEEADDHDDDENTQICNSFGPVAPKSTTTTSYTSSSWTYQHSSPKINYPLLALTHGLLSLPNGPDAGPLTHLIQHCRLHQRYNVLLSEVAAVLKEVGIKPVIEAGERGCADEEVVGRYRREWREARKRRMKEDGGGGKRRKVG